MLVTGLSRQLRKPQGAGEHYIHAEVSVSRAQVYIGLPCCCSADEVRLPQGKQMFRAKSWKREEMNPSSAA